MANDGYEPEPAWTPPPEYAWLPDTAKALVAHLRMQKIPHEGPRFIEIWRGTERVGGELAARYRARESPAPLSTRC